MPGGGAAGMERFSPNRFVIRFPPGVSDKHHVVGVNQVAIAQSEGGVEPAGLITSGRVLDKRTETGG